MALFPYLLLCLMGLASSQNATEPDNCEWETGPWGTLLEDWATAPVASTGRHGRIMALTPANGYYVSERIDGPFVPPPPPPPPALHPGSTAPAHPPGSYAPAHPPGSYGPAYSPGPHGPPHPPALHKPQNYNEWDSLPEAGKIVNRPPNPYKDKFKPSYEYSPTQAPPPPPRPARPAADRVDAPSKQASETDLYLLGAIEKLVYRADLFEKRLRRLEESLHLLVAGTETAPDPCPTNFTRVGEGCYQWSRAAADWKGASVACRRARASLLELPEARQRRVLLARLLSDPDLKGSDFWTSGLNPGLLWIWSHSARPLADNATAPIAVAGEGRCLALAHDPAAAAYAFRGRDCSLRHRYICQKEDDKAKLGNDIQKAARSLRLEGRRAKVLWDDVKDKVTSQILD